MTADLISMLGSWASVWKRPSERTFATERTKSAATLRTALVGVLALGLLSALFEIVLKALTDSWVLPQEVLPFTPPSDFVSMIIGLIYGVVFQFLELNFLLIEWCSRLWAYSGLVYLVAGNSVFNRVYIILFVELPDILVELPSWQPAIAKGILKPVGFLIRVFIYHQVATLLGGQGQLGRFAFLLVSISAVMTLLHTALDYFPLATGYLIDIFPGFSPSTGQVWYYTASDAITYGISLIFLLYFWILFFLAIKAEYGLSWWRALAGTLISYVLYFALGTFFPSGIFTCLIEAARGS